MTKLPYLSVCVGTFALSLCFLRLISFLHVDNPSHLFEYCEHLLLSFLLFFRDKKNIN